jgi:hypothetical protein
MKLELRRKHINLDKKKISRSALAAIWDLSHWETFVHIYVKMCQSEGTLRQSSHFFPNWIKLWASLGVCLVLGFISMPS